MTTSLATPSMLVGGKWPRCRLASTIDAVHALSTNSGDAMKVRSFLASAAASAVLATLLIVDAEAAAPRERLIALHRVNVDVASLAEEVARATGKTMIISPAVKVLVSLDTRTPVSAEVLFETFVRVLTEQGLRVTESPNGSIRITTPYESLGLTWT
jgi:type II secretory pathway component GspD/PulD (secretin)